MHLLWYEIIQNIYNYRKLYRWTISIIKKENRTEEMLSKEENTVIQKFLQWISEKILGVQKMYTTEIDYVNENDVESNFYKYKNNRIMREQRHRHKHVS